MPAAEQKNNDSFRVLIDGCAKNDRKSQEELYRHFFPIMERMVRRYTSDEDQIISILNNGFLKVFKNIERYEFAGSFEGWIRKIIFRSLSDYMRSGSKDVKYLVFEKDFESASVQIENELYFEDLLNMVNSLPEMKMKVFQLHAIEGYKHNEIGEILGINENTSRWYLKEARTQLKQIITRNKRYRDAG